MPVVIKMARRLIAIFKNSWAKELVLVMFFTIMGLAIIMPPLSPNTKYAAMINQVTPYCYPVSVGDGGNGPTCPATPRTSRVQAGSG